MDTTRFLALVADDDPHIAKLLEETLKLEACDVVLAHDGQDACQAIDSHRFHLAVIDLEMPAVNGQAVVRHLRRTPQGHSTFVLILTSHSDLSDRIASFHAGADDFLSKPFELMELTLRARAALRRQAQREPFAPPCDGAFFKLDPFTRQVTAPHGQWSLTPMEFQLLAFLAAHAGECFQSDDLLQRVFNYAPRTGDTNLIRYHVRNLRKKIEPDPRRPRYLVRMPDGGYGLFAAAGG